jgi:hypothetical protein
VSPNYYTSFYNDGIHEAAKWQFWSNTQFPLSSAAFTNCSAFPPCPCPSEIDSVFFYIYLANFKKSVTGSEPGESKNMSGVKHVESLKHLAKSNTGGMINYFPNFSVIQFSIAGRTLSILIAFKTIIFSKLFTLPSQPLGNCSDWGCMESKILLNESGFFINYS